jgi:pimeloyl-ACP methyl ester carboxylesterase
MKPSIALPGNWFGGFTEKNPLRAGIIVLVGVFGFMPLFLPAQTNLRAWFAAGQTWLVWEDEPEYPDTYLIYKSNAPITDLQQAELIGRIFSATARGMQLKRFSDSLTWMVPDGYGSDYILADNEGLFVYTPYSNEEAYFAVVRNDQQVFTEEHRSGPVTQSLEPIQCHFQTGGSDQGFAYRIMAHWIDGNPDFDSARSDYPVMGNEHFNGAGYLFRIWEHPEGELQEKFPLSIVLHGGGGWYGAFSRPNDFRFKTGEAKAMVYCPDDGAIGLFNGNLKSLKTYWIGYRTDYNPFIEAGDQPVPDEALVVDYTMRRILWEIDWLVANEGVDPLRVSVMGGSMGARGANYLARRFPDRIAAYLSLSPGVVPQPNDPLVGAKEQNLLTNLPGDIRVLDIMDLHSKISGTNVDIPFGKIVGGRNDGSLAGLSADVVQAYNNVNDSAMGTHIYWDDRGHVFTAGSYWADSYRLTAEALIGHVSKQSFPGFFNDDQDPGKAGRQPELLSGGPEVGDPWGTWGGYYWWDPASIVDLPNSWKVNLGLVTESGYLHDVPDFGSSITDFVLRKPLQFSITAGQVFHWKLMRISDGQILQAGSGQGDADGRVIVHGLSVSKAPSELSIQVDGPTWAGYPIFDEAMNVDTADFLGWINVHHADYIWSYNMENWLYCPEAHVADSGAWVFLVNQEGAK